MTNDEILKMYGEIREKSLDPDAMRQAIAHFQARVEAWRVHPIAEPLPPVASSFDATFLRSLKIVPLDREA
jgi:hypothetical protein